MIHGVNKISKTRSLFFVLLVFLPGFLFLPNIGFAQIFQDIKSDSIEKHLELQGRDAQDLLMTLIQKFTDKKIDLETSGISSARERAVPCILRKAVRINVLNHLLKDAPIEITGKIIKTGLSIAKLFFAKDISVFIDEFEKQALKIAINKGMNFLFVQDIRISPGTMEFKYISQNKNEKEIVFQHIIIYKSLTPEKGKAQIRIYSPESIEPPKVEGSFGGMWGIYHEFEKDLSPFIVSIQGTVEKIGSSGFRWIDGPDISIDFPETVPDLGIKPLGFWEKHFFKPIETEIKKIKIVITKITGESPEINENDILEFSDAVRSIWDKAKTFFSKYNPFEAGLVRILKLSTQTFSKPNLTEKSFENKDDSKQEEQNEDYSINNNQIFLTQLSDIQEQLDDIAEHIDVLAQKKIKQSDRISENLSESVNKKNFDKQKNRKTDNKEIDKTDEDKLNQEQEELEQEQIIEKAVSRAAIICERNLSNRAARNKIIFNEIAWMGSLNSFNDEWIELKNISNKEVSLAGWQLLDKNRDIEIIFDEQDFIPVNGFFLLERTDDDSVWSIDADLIYTGALNNTNESLYLFDEKCQIQDQVFAAPDWTAGDSSVKRTMERKSDLQWQTSSYINGTPKKQNSAGYYCGKSGSGSQEPEPEPKTESEIETESAPEPELSRIDNSEIIICSHDNFRQPIHQPVIFNEIAWMGTKTDWRNEWIELKNISNKEVSLAGWQLLDKNRDIEIIFDEQDFIPVNGFFLLERTDDDSVPNIKADKIYTGWLSNQNESLRLFDQNCNLIDEILAVPDWLAGDNLEKQTMERYQDLTWHNYCGCELNGILGSPKQENSFFEQQDQGEQEQSQDKEQDQDNPAQQSMISEDITPPIVNFTTVSHIQDSLNFSVLWSARDVSSTISSMDGVLFTASPSGIDGFYVQYIVTPVLEGITPILNGLKYLEQGEWVAWLENKIIKIKDTILYLIGIDEQSYDFQIQALDNAGNKSEWIDGPCVNISVPKPILDIDQEVVEFTAIEFGLNPEEQILVISNLGSAVLEWEAVTSCDAEWIKMDLISGQILQGSKTEISLSADISDKKFGKYSAKIIIFSEYQEKEISVILDLEKDVISPETYLDTKFLPKNPCNSAQAMFYFNSDEDAGFECQLDDQDWWDCGSGEQGFSDLRQGWHKFNVRAIDKAGNIDLSPASYSWLIDTSPGTVVFSLFPFQTEPCFDFSFEMFDQGVSPSGLDGFYFREKRGNSEWQEQEYKKIPDSRYSFLEQRKFIGEDKQTYYFQVKIKDKAGNISEWLPELPAMTEISIPDSIKINQIKIADSEYIELYNPLDKDIDLSGFYLSYFSMNKDCEKDIENCLQWNEPSRNWQFTDKEFIASKEFYLIQVSGDKHDISIIPDWRIKKYDGTIYQSSQLSNTSGAIVVFSSNPEQEICSESAQQNYIDAFAWGKTQIVKETDPFSDFSLNDVKNKVFSRRQNAWDTNNNSLDFILKSENFHNSKRLSVWINDYPNQLNYVSKHPDFILRWFSIDPEVKYYEVDYKAEKDEQWQEFYQGADRQKEFISRRDYINYSFRIRAITEKNDISKQKQADVYIASLPITINEVMYYPETNDNYCEYVELYNNTDKDIDLNGWKLRVKKWKKYYDLELVIDTENSGISSIIKPGGFAIIGDEPDKDKHIYNKDLCQYQIPDYSEQVIRLKVKNENLSLINSGQGFISLKNVQDEIIDDFCYSSYWGAKRNGKSFQKLKPTHFSNLRYNWDQALPSPGKQNTNFDQNSLNYLIYWHNILSDYYIFSQKSGPYSIKSSFTVPVDKNLIIEPGVVIKFDNNNMSRISVYGNLFVQGEQENPVVFTSFSDDEYAGDTNKNGDLTLPKPGQWDGIRFEADSAGILENAIIRYGSSSTSWSGFCGRNSGRAMVRIEQADVSFNNVIIEKAKCKGLEIIDSDIVIENSVFRDFVKTNKTKPVAVLLQSGAITIKKSVFKNNYQGFYNLSRDKIIFENNIFRNNNQSAYIGLTDFYPLDNIMEDNDINGFEISGGLFKDLILRRDDNVPYVVINDILIPDGFLLEIQPGVIIKFKKSNDSCYKHSINVYGILLAQADSDNMIVFTSSSDSDFGGQTDKNFTIAKPGDWESIRFFNTGSILDNVMIRYGGLGGWSTAAGHIVREPAVVVESGDIVIRNSVIENNRMTGLEINDSVAVLENTIFRNHTGTYYRTYPNKALTIKNSEMSFIDCYFENNVYDVYWPYSKGECDLLSSSGNLSFDADGPSIECLARSLLE